jgi:hypothetical protein
MSRLFAAKLFKLNLHNPKNLPASAISSEWYPIGILVSRANRVVGPATMIFENALEIVDQPWAEDNFAKQAFDWQKPYRHIALWRTNVFAMAAARCPNPYTGPSHATRRGCNACSGYGSRSRAGGQGSA